MNLGKCKDKNQKPSFQRPRPEKKPTNCYRVKDPVGLLVGQNEAWLKNNLQISKLNDGISGSRFSLTGTEDTLSR